MRHSAYAQLAAAGCSQDPARPSRHDALSVVSLFHNLSTGDLAHEHGQFCARMERELLDRVKEAKPATSAGDGAITRVS